MADPDPGKAVRTARPRRRASGARDSGERDDRLRELEHALHAARIGTFDWDVARDVLHYSVDADRIFGTREPMPGDLAGFLARVHRADRESIARSVAAVFNSPVDSFVQIEYRVDGDDGEQRWVRSQGRVLRDAVGRPRRVVGTLMDVSDRKALETQLMQSQKMESVGRLAGGVAHDFNNLLTAMFGELELVGEAVPAGSELADSLAAIQEAAERARQLTAQLLAFARRQVFELQIADVNALLVQLSDLLRRILGEDVRLSIRTAPDLWRARIDTHQLEQVIVNLAVNAREAMPHGGTLVLETRNRPDGSCPVAGDHVWISARDSGTGMSEDVRLRAFEPFFTTKELGTGLGLSTCYGIVEQLGGHLSLASKPGAGTEASVFLPRAEGAEQAASVTIPGPAEGGEVILVVEDEPAVRSMTARGLRKHGYTVLEATHGAEALACLRDGPLAVDVLVTDVVMPEMSGRQLAERALSLSPATRVLFVSGYADAVVERHGVREIECAFLQKPYTPALLARRIRELLGGATAAARRPGARGSARA